KTSRDTCGGCHFRGGGGDGVKHGDMDSSLASPEKELDVHMDVTGLDFSCGTCHKSSSHDIAGSRYTPTAMDKGGYHIPGKPDQGNPATCQACHGNTPHKVKAMEVENHGARLNEHTAKLACQTCHIPAIARGGVATKLSWDWSTAGKMGEDGKPMTKKDEHGHVIYDSRKGDFVLGENVIPEYYWFNGKVTYTLLGDKVDKSKGVTPINRIEGSAEDGTSMIWPMKVMRGKQPFDPVNQTLVMPHTAGDDKIGYWKNFEWEKAIADGMQNMGAPFSGKIDFIETEMFWPITHMVAPKENALACVDCHNATNGRLKNVKGIYLPSAGNNNQLLDMAGWGIALLTLIGVLIHGAIRIFAHKKG
ncbi:MAG TPA: tetrathionate reductase family octaheme c-type cytochrome, partial [Gammaproteobacteria bacterium]|nr:tetrathionate reductase family octaheme c-type cytochrome [Gammaproteobacteria bacterium]